MLCTIKTPDTVQDASNYLGLGSEIYHFAQVSRNEILSHRILELCFLVGFITYMLNYFILYSENQCISKLDKIGIFIDQCEISLTSNLTDIKSH